MVTMKVRSVHLRTRIARFGGVDKKEKDMKFDPKDIGWKEAISQMNFVGTGQVKNVREGKDYDIEVDIKLKEAANYPGGPRGRVDLKTGSHYVVWLYPALGELKLYKNPGWDINAGIKTIGAGKFKPKVDEYHKIKLSIRGSDIKSIMMTTSKLRPRINPTNKVRSRSAARIGSFTLTISR